MSKQHSYTSTIIWTGDRGQGNAEYRAYDRTWEVRTPGKPVISCSNDPLLGGDPSRPNPEDMLLSSLSACHMLWYLHLACNAGVLVSAYEDEPVGVGETSPDGAGRFLRATLRPTIQVKRGTDLASADALHQQVHQYCFIARSVNFPVACEARYIEHG
jgi:organic hydroperoxide reductase OsmC/OhrA